MGQQNIAIVKSLVCVAWADGQFDEKEREMVEALIVAYEFSEAEATAIRAYAGEAKTLDDVPAAELSDDDSHELLQHAVLLTFVGGEQSEAERAFLTALIKKLKIPNAEHLTPLAEARAKRFLNIR